MKWIYNITIHLLALVYLPKLIYQRLRFGKYRHNLLYKLGLKLPKPIQSKKPLIWIHACSLGETKAASTLASYFHADLVISSTTETGHECAKKLLPHATHVYLPFDFPWAIKRLFRRIKPDLLILVESDFWLNFMRLANCKIALVSGVLSEKTLKRHLLFPSFAKQLFSHIDLFLVQNTVYKTRFEKLGITSQVAGNLKYDLPNHNPAPEDFLITIGSTHEGEEKLLIQALKPLLKKYPNLKIQMAPRHPERFELIKKLLEHSPIIPITEMGVLTKCYAKSKLAIVAGSFVKGIGGHNILEPVQLGVPVLFGPYMDAQEELKELVLKANAGEAHSASHLAAAVEKHLASPSYHSTMSQNALRLARSLQGASKKTFVHLSFAFKELLEPTSQSF